MSYRDRCWCSESKKEWSNSGNLCTNCKCDRHASNIPFDKLPEWELFSMADFSQECGKYKYENIERIV